MYLYIRLNETGYGMEYYMEQYFEREMDVMKERDRQQIDIML